MSKVLIICLSDPSKAPRPKRMVEYCLERGNQVSVLSPPPNSKVPGVEYFSTGSSHPRLPPLIIRNIRNVSGAIIQKFLTNDSLKEGVINLSQGLATAKAELLAKNFDLVLVEDLDCLPFAFSIRKSAKVIFDAREFYPKQRENNLFFRHFQAPYRTQICRNYLPKCSGLITVSPGIASKYEEEFGVHAKIFRSTPNLHQLPTRTLSAEKIRMVHHGLANPNRQLEKMVDVFSLLDSRFHLDMYLTGNSFVIRELRLKARNIPNLRILDPVPLKEIIPTISNYDIGFFYVEPLTFNLKYCLPNKLFEFIQARLAVAIGPSPDMARIVEQNGCGFVSKKFTVESMAERLTCLSASEIQSAKEKSNVAAFELCFEKEKQVLDDLLDGLECRL